MSWDFLAPGRLWLLVLVAGLVGAYVLAQRRRAVHTVRFTQIEMLDQIAPRRPGWRRHAVAGVQLAALTIGVFGVAQPVERSTVRPKAAGKIMLLFDVSLSMESNDVAPNRLDAAKKAGEDFVDAVDPDVDVGLISFSGTVSTDVEPTTDRAQLTKAIEALQLGEGTAIGDAIAAGVHLLQRGQPATADSPGTLVVLSDGETTRGRPTADGAQVAADAHVPVYTIAFGTDSGTITNPQTGQIDPVPVKLDELQSAADATGGKAYVAPSSADLAKAYADIRANLKQTVGDAVVTIHELTWRYVLAAVVLLMIAWALGLWWLRGPL
ncbi:MAG: Ca-activated chloride channel [Ilumatobacteraceae bacterium]|jgi:Ca-activated chloride channel family protein